MDIGSSREPLGKFSRGGEVAARSIPSRICLCHRPDLLLGPRVENFPGLLGSERYLNYLRPRRAAAMTAWTRVSTFRALRTAPTWFLTVPSARFNTREITLLDLPASSSV